MNEIRALNNHKDALVKRLSEELVYSKKLQRERDSLLREIGEQKRSFGGSDLKARD